MLAQKTGGNIFIGMPLVIELSADSCPATMRGARKPSFTNLPFRGFGNKARSKETGVYSPRLV
jgi:hypothetical protein